MKVPSRSTRTEAPKRPTGEKASSGGGAPGKAQAHASQQAEGLRQVQPNADAAGAGEWAGGGDGGVAESEADPLWGGRSATSGTAKGEGAKDPRALPAMMSPRDAFAAQTKLAQSASSRQVRETLGAEVTQQLPPSRTDGQDPLAALNRAQEPGVYFKEDEDGGNRNRRDGGEAEVDPELEEALEETLQLLFGVPGIHRVSPGTDDSGRPVVLIFATRGFGAPSMARVPDEVRGFKTLLVLPYQLLPLRRLV